MRRGDLVIASIPGDFGKPRPVLVVQDDAFDSLPAVTVLPLTTHLHDAPLLRIGVEPGQENGLETSSQIMTDRVATIRRGRIRQHIGRVDDDTMRAVNLALANFLGLA